MSHIGISVSEIDGAIQDVHLDDFGNLAMAENAEAIAQHCKQRLKTFSGEWFLNTEVGVPWLSDVFAQSYNPSLSEAIIKSSIRRTDGVTEIASFSIRFDKDFRNLISDGIVINTIYDNLISL